MLRRLLLLALLVAVMLVGSTPTGAYTVSGKPWPGGVIRYYNAATDQQWAVDRAIATWNASGAAIRFVRVPSDQAQLVIRHPSGPCPPAGGHVGEATVGYAVPQAVVYLYPRDDSSPSCNPYMTALTAGHEIGHVLGLGHENRGCALMNPSGNWVGPQLCTKLPRWQWDCRLLEADDIAGAVALYGGRPRPPAAGGCDLYPQGASPSALRVAYTEARGVLQVSFRRPATPAIPAFVPQRPTQESYAVTFTPGSRCAAVASRHSRYRWDVAVGAVETSHVHYTGQGVGCLVTWAFDATGRPSRPGALLVTVR